MADDERPDNGPDLVPDLDEAGRYKVTAKISPKSIWVVMGAIIVGAVGIAVFSGFALLIGRILIDIPLAALRVASDPDHSALWIRGLWAPRIAVDCLLATVLTLSLITAFRDALGVSIRLSHIIAAALSTVGLIPGEFFFPMGRVPFGAAPLVVIPIAASSCLVSAISFVMQSRAESWRSSPRFVLLTSMVVSGIVAVTTLTMMDTQKYFAMTGQKTTSQQAAEQQAWEAMKISDTRARNNGVKSCELAWNGAPSSLARTTSVVKKWGSDTLVGVEGYGTGSQLRCQIIFAKIVGFNLQLLKYTLVPGDTEEFSEQGPLTESTGQHKWNATIKSNDTIILDLK